MINNLLINQIIFDRRKKILKQHDIELTSSNNSSFVYVQIDDFNLPISLFAYTSKTDSDFLIYVLNEFNKTKNKYNSSEKMSKVDFKRQLHRKKRLLEDYYIIPVFALNNDSNFKLRKLQMSGNIEILYPYDDFCNKNDSDLIDDVLDKFRNNEKYRDLKPITPYKPKVSYPIVHNSGINFLPKSEKVKIPSVNIEEKKNNIRTKLIERGFICQI